MARKGKGKTAPGTAKNAARGEPAPPTEGAQPITTDNDEEMEDDIYNGPNPLHDESDEVLAGTIVHLAKEPNEAVSQVVADEIMTRLRRLRRLESGKAPETGSVGIDVTRIQESIVDAVVDGVGQGTGRAMEEVRKQMQEVRKEMQEVQKELQEARRELQDQRKKQAPAPATTVARSWAAVVAGEGELPKKIIPGRLNKEILVRGSIEPSLTRRSPQEIVQAVNGVSERKGAVAARKLPSGDVIVTFQDAETKEWHAKNAGCIGTAFGEVAKEAKRTFAVLVKGMLKRDLRDVTEAAFGKQLGLQSVERVKFRIPTIEGVTRATALVTMTSQEESKRACEEGVVWRAQMLNCEPYWSALQATQCYRCWKWGHTQRFCKKSALCPRCGTAAHGGGGRAGEAQCPTHGNEIPYFCPCCSGKHPAWVRWCPEAVKARGAAREAYHFRPRTFELALQQQTQQQQERLLPRMRSVTFRGASTLEEADDGFQEAGKRKRPRGRPPVFLIAQEEAARSSRQGKLTFARKVDTDLTGYRGDGVGGLGVTTPEAADTLEADGQDVGMQGAG